MRRVPLWRRLLRLPRCENTWGDQWSWGEHRCCNRAEIDGLCVSCYASRKGYQLTPVTQKDIDEAVHQAYKRLTER